MRATRGRERWPCASSDRSAGWPVLRATVPALVFLLLIVPPPFNLDGKLVTNLQSVTSRAGSRVLDYIPVLHYLDGNTFEIGEKRYFVDTACSGINSLFSTLARWSLGFLTAMPGWSSPASRQPFARWPSGRRLHPTLRRPWASVPCQS